MTKHLTFTLLLAAMSLSAIAQGLYKTDDAHIWFYSYTIVEDIEAHSHTAKGALNPTTGAVAFSVKMTSFEFPKSLMQEHFNENYMESEKYPNGSFAGTITNLSEIDFSKKGSYKAMVEGKFTVHGKTNEIKTEGQIEVLAEDKIRILCDFKVRLEDHKIKIPKIVLANIAEVIDAHIDATLLSASK